MAEEPDHLGLLVDDALYLPFCFGGVVAEGKGDVVEQVHRPEESPVLEEHPELSPDIVEIPLSHAHDRIAVHDDVALVGLE